MLKINPLLLTDFYKTTHYEQYPKDLTKMVSYFTPRMSRLNGEDKLIMFGLQAFCKEFLVEHFNKNFFDIPKDKVLSQYKKILDNTLGVGTYDLNKIERLHYLGYLPLEINAIPEGSRVDMKVPMIEITNTHPDFVWLVNTIETPLCAYLWHAMVSANVGYRYRKIVDKYYDISVDDDVPRARALGDFSMRGQESIESAIISSAAWLLSFLNTATIPAIPWLEKYYNCNCENEQVGFGAISTEHSVMCSNYAIDGDEISHIRRLLTKVYPNNNFSMVSDSYNYWNLVDSILPQLHEEILMHNGCLSIRGDSGDPVQIVTETVFHLWEQFGGTINSKGYKVLNPRVKAIYGDSITPDRAIAIYEILIKNGFACNCVSLGVGSFSMQCLEDEKGFHPYTRDTYSIAVKATYAEDKDGKPIMIFKNPITDDGHFKKSQKGCCIVRQDETGNFNYEDNKTWRETFVQDNCFKGIFLNGLVKTKTLQEVREVLWKGKF